MGILPEVALVLLALLIILLDEEDDAWFWMAIASPVWMDVLYILVCVLVLLRTVRTYVLICLKVFSVRTTNIIEQLFGNSLQICWFLSMLRLSLLFQFTTTTRVRLI